ncbi:unnamed protein product, partial [Didymodactylos carnosus]
MTLDNYEIFADPRATAATTTIHDEEEADLSVRRGGLKNHSKRTKKAAFRSTTTNNYPDDVNRLPTTQPRTGRKTTKTKLPAIDRGIIFSRWSAYDKNRAARTLEEHYEQVVLAYPKFGYIQKPLYGKNF